jgi:multimeric flavodoxin WrbA
MYVLGLSGGRRMGNSEVLVREALMGAEELGARVEIIRLMDLDIKAPLGEDTVGSDKRPDHTSFLNKKMVEADGIIVSCPSYALTPPGYVINIRDRVSLRHGPPKKLQVGALIGVGGSDWVQLLLPMMYLILPHGQCKLVDQMLVTHTVSPGQVVLNEKAIARARRLGRNVAEALKMPADKVKYVGEEYFTCPICYQNLLKVRGKFVECPICDIKGTIEVKKDGIKVTFAKKDMETHHWGPQGLKRHMDIIVESGKIYKERLAEVKKKLKKYEAHIAATVPPAVAPPPPLAAEMERR